MHYYTVQFEYFNKFIKKTNNHFYSSNNSSFNYLFDNQLFPLVLFFQTIFQFPHFYFN